MIECTRAVLNTSGCYGNTKTSSHGVWDMQTWPVSVSGGLQTLAKKPPKNNGVRAATFEVMQVSLV